jgi:hypothetical protein
MSQPAAIFSGEPRLAVKSPFPQHIFLPNLKNPFGHNGFILDLNDF